MTPGSGGKANAAVPRFVILEHDHPHLHWDFMLEAGASLRTWRLESPPSLDRRVAAERLADHRLAYLEYEGPVSGQRGSVRRWDSGTYTWTEDAVGRIAVRLEGVRCRGTAVLTLCDENAWELAFEGSLE